MADAVISIVREKIVAILQDQISNELNLVRGVEEKALQLSKELENIKDVIDDAEKRGVTDKSVKNWLKELNDTIYEMDDILDEWKYTLLTRKKEEELLSDTTVCCSFISYTCLYFKKLVDRRTIASKINNVKAALDGINKRKDDFNFIISRPSTDQLPHSRRDPSTSSIDLDGTYGRDKDRCNIVRLLMDNDDSRIVSIVGMGGIGKTTLAQLVYNDNQVKEYFPLRIWICVSYPFDMVGIARGIIEKVRANEIIPPYTWSQWDLVLEKLRECITGKKFLLVLDDVWEEDYNKWKPLKINLEHGASTSKILVTTRNERVARMMRTIDDKIYHPNKLTNEECWLVLRHMSLAGRSEEECEVFEDFGKKIAIKCEGLPLAAKVLGSLLQFKNNLQEWENILESEIWKLEEAKLELFPHLLLSYNELSPDLKRCFSYCAVYPKDNPINSKYLIEEWMALGYLGRHTGNGGAEGKGQAYVNSLAMRCLFQDVEKSEESGNEILWCRMHDIVHDFAQFLRKNNGRAEAAGMTERSCQVCKPSLLSDQAQEYRILFWGNESPPSICDCIASVRVFRLGWWQWGSESPFLMEEWIQVIRLVMRGMSSNADGADGVPPGMEKLIHLRCIQFRGIKLSKEDLNVVTRLYFLQTLRLVSCFLEEIPSEIENLVELRLLDLTDNRELKELPNSMCSLVELKVLDITGCDKLSQLPEGIHRLQNLQHLLTDENFDVMSDLPQGVGQLNGLRTFGGMFYGGSGVNKLGLLKGLNSLTGSLELKIWWSDVEELGELVEDAREAELRNKVHIQSLVLNFFVETDKSSSTMWMNLIEALEPHLKLKQLRIWGYPGSRLPRWISSPYNLVKQIYIHRLEELTSLPSMGKLPYLEHLKMYTLSNLRLVGREFLGIECSSSSSTTNDVVVAFPKLKKLVFDYIPKWTEWEDIMAEEEESVAVCIMPCLTELIIQFCDGLGNLPHRLLRKVSSSLEFLNVNHSKELKANYGDEDGLSYFDIPCRNNPKLDNL